MRLTDFDNLSPEDVVHLWKRFHSASLVHEADPELRADLERVLVDMPPDQVVLIRRDLDEFHPGVVLQNWWSEFCRQRFGKDQPTIGAYSSYLRKLMVPSDWILEDPSRIGNVAGEVVLYGSSVSEACRMAFECAESLGLDLDKAEQSIADAMAGVLTA